MSMAESETGGDATTPLARQRLRSVRIALPVDPTEEELARDWTLSEADLTEVLRCRGDSNRRRFAVQLCVLRKHGRFLDEYNAVPVRVVNHLSRQLDLPPTLFIEDPERDATESEYQSRLRHYLGYQSFEQEAQQRLIRWLEARATEGSLPNDLLHRAAAQLRAWRVVPPATSTLERLVASVATHAQQEVFERIAIRLSPALGQAIEELLQVAPGDQKSELFRLKEYPPEASAKAIRQYLARFRQANELVADQINLGGINPELVRHLSSLAKRYDAQALKRFAPEKRSALLACFLAEAEKTLLDHVVEMNDQFLTTMCRHARHHFEEKHRQFRRRAKEGITVVLEAMDILFSAKQSGVDALFSIYSQIAEPRLRDAVESCREFKRLEERGYLDELCARYTNLRRYLPDFLKLPFAAEAGNEDLTTTITLLRHLDAGEIRQLPDDAPSSFIPAAWRPALYRADGTLERRIWVIGLSLAVRDRLRAGDLYLTASRRHVSFWNLVYDEQQWEEEKGPAYEALVLPTAADKLVERLKTEYAEAVGNVERGLDGNPFATVREGRLHLKRPDALEVSERVKQLRQLVKTSLPRVRIEDLLLEIDRLCGFTNELRPLGGYAPRAAHLYPTLLAAVIAHGTNLGIAAMGHSVEGMTVDMLQHVTRFFLSETTLKATNAALVNFHHRLAFSEHWGQGISSSSDGQRFGIQASSLLASFYPRYFGYYERAITLYTHVSDQHSVFGTQVISCSPREALYVLDGLLENDTILRPREHYTDTHGFTEQLFGLCYLLGYSFMPRLRDLADQQLYKVDKEVALGRLQPLFHMGVDVALIREQWDQLVRVVASLKNRVAPAHVVLQRLTNASPSDRVAKALTALGRIVKTIFILRYIHEEKMRRRVQLQLNRGEARHDLAKWLFFANRGEFRTGDYEEIMNKASCLSLLSNAALVWNTVEMAKIVERLRASGEEIATADLAKVSPMAFHHVIPNGTYHFRGVKRGDDIAYNTPE